MKTKLALSIALFLFVNCLFAQTSGGPDNYGYTWKNSLDTVNPPVYKWKEINGVGTQITGMGDDNLMGPINFGFNFHFYWVNYNKIWFGSNGYLSFIPGVNIAAPFVTLPTPNSKNTINPLQCDLTFIDINSAPVAGATSWYWTNNSDSIIFQYDSVPYWVKNATNYDGRYTFQVILCGADSSITFQYKLAQAGSAAYGTSTEHVITGIENSTGQIGLQVSNDVFPAAGTAVKFYYPHPVTYQVFDVTPAWNQNTDNGGFFVSANGAPLNMKTDILNSGNQNVTGVAVTGKILDKSSTQVWDTAVTVASLAAGADSMFIYPKMYSANTPGSFQYQSTTVLSSDINPANDVTTTEMKVVDTTKSVIGLTYADTITPSHQLSWTGGNGGAAVYIVPPFYPAVLLSTDYYVTTLNKSGGFKGEIFSDNGPNGTMGTLLYSDSMKVGGALVANAYNKINIAKPIVVTSGGVYVAWVMIGDTIGIGVDINAPFSLRNFEGIGGAWGSYRNNLTQDLMIRQNIGKYNFGTVTTSQTADGCPSNNSGSATASVSAGMSPPYTYLWSPGGQTTTSITGVAAGNYTVTITDSLGIAKKVLVPVYNNIAVSISSSKNVSCFGGNNGAAAVTIGGTAPYTYLWSPGGQTTSAVTGLSAGVYTALATNTSGCSSAVTDTIKSPAIIATTYSTTASTCVGNDGIANAIVTGGSGTYTYVWGTAPVQTTNTATGLIAGSYSLVVLDSAGCSNSSSTTITNIPFTASIANTTTVSCYGGADGTATASATSGGTAPYTYLWNSSPVQSTATATGLGAASYTVLITDAAGCTSSQAATLTGATQMIPTFSVTPASCPNCTNGTASISMSGGMPGYKYLWSNGQTFKLIIGLIPGNYTVCTTDKNGCKQCDTVSVLMDGITELYSGASVTVSPNPFRSAANVKIDLVNPSHNKLIFTMFDMFGREVEAVDLSTTKGGSIDFTLNRGYNIPGGMYFYRLIDDKNILSTGKLLVQ